MDFESCIASDLGDVFMSEFTTQCVLVRSNNEEISFKGIINNGFGQSHEYPEIEGRELSILIPKTAFDFELNNDDRVKYQAKLYSVRISKETDVDTVRLYLSDSNILKR